MANEIRVKIVSDTSGGGDSVERLERKLDQLLGPLPRTLGPTPPRPASKDATKELLASLDAWFERSRAAARRQPAPPPYELERYGNFGPPSKPGAVEKLFESIKPALKDAIADGLGEVVAGPVKRLPEPFGGFLGGAASSLTSSAVKGQLNAEDPVAKAQRKLLAEATAAQAADAVRQMREAYASGFSKAEAEVIGRARAAVNGAERTRKGLDQQRGGRRLSDIDEDLQQQYRGAKQQFSGGGAQLLKSFTTGLQSLRATDARGLVDRFTAVFDRMPRYLQQQGADSMLALARGMERSKAVPRGTVDKLTDELKRRFNGLAPSAERGGFLAMRALDRSLNDRALIRSADRLVHGIGERFDVLRNVTVRTLAGAAAALKAGMQDLEQKLKEGGLAEHLVPQAKKELSRLERVYEQTLSRLARRFDVSKDQAKEWSDAVARAARRAGNGRTQIDALADGVAQLRRRFQDGKEAAESLRAALQRLADTDIPALQPLPPVPKRPKAKKKKPPKASNKNTEAAQPEWGRELRRGGMIGRFQDGGLVPALVSSGERIDYGGQSMIVPGARVAADNVPMMLPVGAQVFTDHGQRLLDAGASPAQALAQQAPHFAKGGVVVAARAARGAGLTGSSAVLATAIAGAESGYDPEDRLNNPPIEDSRGLWQINTLAHKWAAKQNMYDPDVNARAMMRVSDGGRDWTPWAGYKSGNYRAFMDRSRKAVVATRGGRNGTAASGDDDSGTKLERVLYSRSRTRGGLLDDAYTTGFDAVSRWGTRKQARWHGVTGTETLRAALDEQRDSYTREVEASSKKRSSGNRGGGTSAGTTVIDGKPVAGWIAEILLRARQARVPFRVSSGFRTFAEQKRIWDSGVRPAAVPGTSNHEGSTYPRGAVDISDSQAPLRAWLAKRKTRLKWYGPGDRFHFSATGHRRGGLIGFRGGGAVQRFDRGGTAGSWLQLTPGPLVTLPRKTAPVPAPTEAMTASLARLSKSTSNVNLDRFGKAIETAGLEQIEEMRRGLLKSIRKGGDKQAIDRLRTAVSVIEMDIAGRIQERMSSADDVVGKFDKQVARGKHNRAMAGVDESSAIGLSETVADESEYLTRTDPKARAELIAGREQAKREAKRATTKAGRDALREKADGFREKLGELDDRKLSSKEAKAAADRALPQARASEALAANALQGQRAERSGSIAAQQASLGERQALLQANLALARSKDNAQWESEVLSELAQVDSSIKAIPEQGVANANAALDFEAALAALTDDGGADDKAALEKRRDLEQKAADDAIARKNAATNDADYLQAQNEATQHLTALKGIKDSIDAGNQEKKDQETTLKDLIGQMVENQQRIISGSATSRDALVSAIGAAAGGYIGQSVTRGSATPGYASGGVRL